MTCLLHKYLCENPQEDHWTVRDLAAEVLARICKRYTLCIYIYMILIKDMAFFMFICNHKLVIH
jgi:hypothetical protein